MSTALDEQTELEARRSAKTLLLARGFALLAVIFCVSLLWASERSTTARDLKLVSEGLARPGELLAVRALLFERLEDPRGPSLAVAPVHIVLVDAGGRTVSEALLDPQPATQSMEGQIRVPETLTGVLYLEARAELGGELVRCRRPLVVEPLAATRSPTPRMASRLQSFAPGALRPVPGLDAEAHGPGAASVVPTPFLPRVLGGVCIPEAPCTLLVWVGTPAAEVRVRPSPEFDLTRAPEPQRETSGLVALEVQVHGLEAQLTLEAYRQGVRVADRTVRLPVGLGEVGLHVEKPLVEPDADVPASLSLPPGRRAAIVDVFVRGRFRASQTHAASVEARGSAREPGVDANGSSATDAELRAELSAALFPEGEVSRVQARVDIFGGEGEGARLVYRRKHGENPAEALRAIARHVNQSFSRYNETRSWADSLPGFALEEGEDGLQRAAAYLIAPLESLRAPLPEAVSERPLQQARLSARRTSLRFLVGGVLVFAAVLVAATMMRRGLSAAGQARAILERAAEAGGSPSPDPGTAGRFGVVLLVLAVVLAFLAGALLIVAKPLWF